MNAVGLMNKAILLGKALISFYSKPLFIFLINGMLLVLSVFRRMGMETLFFCVLRL